MSEEDVAAALREVLQMVDRVPEAALEAANAAIGWRDLDADLATRPGEDGCLIRIPARMLPEEVSVKNQGPFDATLGRCYRVRSQDANQVVTSMASSCAPSHDVEARVS